MVCNCLYEKILKHLGYLYEVIPRIAIKIESKWGTEAGHRYLKNLIVVDRDTRAGFSEDIFVRVIDLYLLHVSHYGDYGDAFGLTNLNLDIKCKDHRDLDLPQ